MNQLPSFLLLQVTKVMDFGCFVELEGVRGKVREGLVHVGQVCTLCCLHVMGEGGAWTTHIQHRLPNQRHRQQIQQGMLRDPKAAVRRGQAVKVKVISITGTKLSLSMKEVDQRSGRCLRARLRVCVLT